MEIRGQLVRFKYHFAFAIILSVIALSIFHFAPKLVGVLAYFWPLFLSTALSLFAVVVLARTSPPVAETSGEKTGEQILDYVAGKPEAHSLDRKSE